jgi:hypothetical protein
MAKQVDGNQTAVVAALRAAGASVLHLHEIGRGAPDLLVGIAGVDALVEVKDGAKAASARKLNEDQVAWHREWRGRTVTVITSAREAFDFARHLAGGR